MAGGNGVSGPGALPQRADDRAGERHPRLRVQPSGAARIGRAGGARGGSDLRPQRGSACPGRVGADRRGRDRHRRGSRHRAGRAAVELLAVTLADVTGLLAVGAVAALGLYVIPAKRRRAQKDLQEKIAACVPGSARRSPSSSRPSWAARWRVSERRCGRTPVSSRRSRRRSMRASALWRRGRWPRAKGQIEAI